MIKSIQDYRKKTKEYYAKHPKQEIVREYAVSITIMLVSALLYAFSFKVFQSPTTVENNILPLISGGTSGLARSIVVIFNMSGSSANNDLIFAIFYTVLNIPIIYLAFRYIGFRFGLFTAINVVATSILTNFALNVDFVNQLATKIACVTESGLQAGILPRAMLAGVLNGVAGAMCLAFGGSAGGVDTVSYYFSLRRSKNVGRYNIIINTFVFILFASLNMGYEVMQNGDTSTALANFFLILLFVSIFSFTCALVMDFINQHNKKEQIQIITKVENVTKLLLSNIPHGATIVRSKGAFTGEDRIIIYVIVSKYETKTVVNLVRAADPDSFINVVSVSQVYGRFRKPKIK